MATANAAWASTTRMSGRTKLGFAAIASKAFRGFANTPTRLWNAEAEGAAGASVDSTEPSAGFLSPPISFTPRHLRNDLQREQEPEESAPKAWKCLRRRSLPGPSLATKRRLRGCSCQREMGPGSAWARPPAAGVKA